MVFTTEEFLEVAIERWPEWDLNPLYMQYSIMKTLYPSSHHYNGFVELMHLDT